MLHMEIKFPNVYVTPNFVGFPQNNDDIIDMRMPKLTGFEFYRRLCEMLKKDRVPAIFLTGVDNLEENALKNTTIGDYVLKPFSFNILLARIEKVLSY